MAIRTGSPFGSLGCGCDSPKRTLGSIMVGATDQVSDSHSETKRDLIAAGVAFGSLLAYPKVAPKKWPRPKNLWQSLGVVVGVYFASSWAYNKITV